MRQHSGLLLQPTVAGWRDERAPGGRSTSASAEPRRTGCSRETGAGTGGM